MLRIIQLEEIQTLRLGVSPLVDLLESRSPDFAGAVKEWLARVEGVLAANRMPVAGQVAALRGSLIAAERGVVPADTVITGRVTPRKVRDAAASDLLRRADALVAAAVQGDAERVAEGERLMRRIVAVARQKGLTPPGPGGFAGQAGLSTAWSALSSDPDIAGAALHLRGLLATDDVLLLLDRALAS
jgi:hypothetical protein